MKAKCKIWVDDDRDVYLRIRNAGLGISIEFKISRFANGDDYITRNDVEPADTIMGLPPVSLHTELARLVEPVKPLIPSVGLTPEQNALLDRWVRDPKYQTLLDELAKTVWDKDRFNFDR